MGLTNNPVNLVNGCPHRAAHRHHGGGRLGGGRAKRRRRSITRTALTLSLILGTFASAVLYFPAGQLVTFMGAQEDTYLYAKEYLEIVALGMLPAMVGFACTASLRGIGLTRLPMAYNLAGNLFNVIGNYALIYGRLGMPELGVAGAAISTTISRYVACTLALLVLFHVHPAALPHSGRLPPAQGNGPRSSAWALPAGWNSSSCKLVSSCSRARYPAWAR